MATRRVRFPVGSSRISKYDSSSTAGATKDVRRQAAALELQFGRLIENIPGVTENAIRAGLQPIFDTSQKLVPVRTGELRGSGFIKTTSSASGARGVVGYAAASDPFYAAFVHERLDLQHKGITQAKFLEDAVKRHLGEFPNIVARNMKVSLGLGT